MSQVYVCRTLKNLKTLQSPVFLSTGEDGRVQEGCGGIPLDRPLLLVSNHQTFALDIGPLVEGLLRQTGLLPRGLTHPAVFQVFLPLLLIQVTSSLPYVPPGHSVNIACTAGRCKIKCHSAFSAAYTVLSLLAYTIALLCKSTIQTECISVLCVTNCRLSCGIHIVMLDRLVWFLANVSQASVGSLHLLVVLSCRAT